MEQTVVSPPLPGLIEAIRRYPQLAAAGRLPVGDYRAVLLGPAWFRGLAAFGLALGGLPRWVGKRFRPDGSGVNLLRPPSGQGPWQEVLPMQLALAEARHEPATVVRVGYDAAARFPWPAVVDELRPFPDAGPDAWLGMARTDWRLTRNWRLLRLPFLLLRAD